jgi:hypothetical protein
LHFHDQHTIDANSLLPPFTKPFELFTHRALCHEDASGVFLLLVWDGTTALNQMITKHPEILITFFGFVEEARLVPVLT